MGDKMKALLIAKFLGADLHGEDCTVTEVKALDNRGEHSLVFAVGKLTDVLMDVRHVLFITSQLPSNTGFNAFIIVDNPKLAFAKVVGKFFAKSAEHVGKSVIHPTARVGKSIVMGEGCVIGSNAVIGKGTVLRNNVVVGDGVVIGEYCLLMSNCVVGEDGFSFAHEEDGTPVRMPHLGSVMLDDYVEVGNGSIIDRGVLNNTIVHSHVKIDNLVHIAHNCDIGEGTQLAACAEVSGSCNIGKRCWIGAGCSIGQNVVLGDDCLVEVGAVVVKDVPNGVMVMGNPATQGSASISLTSVPTSVPTSTPLKSKAKGRGNK